MQGWAPSADRLPALQTARATLRELQVADAPSLLAMRPEPEVRRFVSDQRDTLENVHKFIDWTHRGRRAGRHLCSRMVPAGSSTAAGLVQVMAMEPSGRTVEWDFVRGPFRGKALFHIVWGDRIGCSDLKRGNSF